MNVGAFCTPEAIAAALSLVLSTVLGLLTWRAVRSACGNRVAILEIEFAGDYAAFKRLLEPLGASGIDRLRVAHYWDCAFAVAYAVAIWAVLQAVAPHLSPGPRGVLYAVSWLGLAAGAFDLLENACLLKGFASLKAELRGGATIRSMDGTVRTAAIAAAIKFVLIGLCINALFWGVVQGGSVYLFRGA